MRVLAPSAGEIMALADVPDPVFAAEMVGAGLAITPGPEQQVAVAPIAGTVVKAMPHAYVVAGPDGAVLVHLGIDTVKLDGAGFEVLVAEKSEIAEGQECVRWTPGDIAAQGLSQLVLVCALDTPAGSVSAEHAGERVEQGAELFTI
ncbi:PTS glucose transporter subunit IIA [Calidifontibacter sp. DB0510]|uniref:PTS glucose transporter subunit IIA n=1 Tax=Metallococcus carri TaxID=1656884 RepID=A0A967AYW8_9MICO|nr:PTS glucose transporter subunit IIA [Metallococcus carri]NHN55626.1 PTS glucose transporter subunit IIA [Metallococcus carri]NOP38190.1 PTS glucose transporter subunit IIA [Calidifontibacter sp. DB2511S]